MSMSWPCPPQLDLFEFWFLQFLFHTMEPHYHNGRCWCHCYKIMTLCIMYDCSLPWLESWLINHESWSFEWLMTHESWNQLSLNCWYSYSIFQLLWCSECGVDIWIIWITHLTQLNTSGELRSEIDHILFESFIGLFYLLLSLSIVYLFVLHSLDGTDLQVQVCIYTPDQSGQGSWDTVV